MAPSPPPAKGAAVAERPPNHVLEHSLSLVGVGGAHKASVGALCVNSSINATSPFCCVTSRCFSSMLSEESLRASGRDEWKALVASLPTPLVSMARFGCYRRGPFVTLARSRQIDEWNSSLGQLSANRDEYDSSFKRHCSCSDEYHDDECISVHDRTFSNLNMAAHGAKQVHAMMQ